MLLLLGCSRRVSRWYVEVIVAWVVVLKRVLFHFLLFAVCLLEFRPFDCVLCHVQSKWCWFSGRCFAQLYLLLSQAPLRSSSHLFTGLP